ncbi:MAG: hypothetical protein LBB61_05475 [Treponema sp.]|nr:hypothetical protein [Treponema sp.]
MPAKEADFMERSGKNLDRADRDLFKVLNENVRRWDPPLKTGFFATAGMSSATGHVLRQAKEGFEVK